MRRSERPLSISVKVLIALSVAAVVVHMLVMLRTSHLASYHVSNHPKIVRPCFVDENTNARTTHKPPLKPKEWPQWDQWLGSEETSDLVSLDDIVLIVKSGEDVAVQRLVPAWISYIHRFPHVMIVGDRDVEINLTEVDLDSGAVRNSTIVMENVLRQLLFEVPYEESTLQMHVEVDIINGALARTRNVKQLSELIPNQNSKGWKNDQLKFLVSLRLAATRYPNAHWFILVDDDTFVFAQNLRRMLHPLSHTDTHYFGHTLILAKSTAHCLMDPTTDASFTHGGSGTVFSQATMKKYMTVAQDCEVTLRECAIGDGAVGGCLASVQVGAGFSTILYCQFNSGPPNTYDLMRIHTPDMLCKSNPITFHHLLEPHMSRLSELTNQYQIISQIDLWNAGLYHPDTKVPDFILAEERNDGTKRFRWNITEPAPCTDRSEL